MPHKLPTLPIRRLTPQPTDMRPHRIQWRLPVDTLRNGIPTMPTQCSHQLSRRTNAVILGKKIHPRRWLSTHVRQQAMPGKHFDRPAMPGLFQRHHGIDHGQARTDDQHCRLRIQLTHRGNIPGIKRRSVQATGLGLWRARSRKHPGRQHRISAPQPLAVTQAQPHRIIQRLQVHHLGPHMLDRRAIQRPQRLRFGQPLLHVQPENPPGRK
ncbi:hypothetical protein D3C84_609100 [compost metagenome]